MSDLKRTLRTDTPRATAQTSPPPPPNLPEAASADVAAPTNEHATQSKPVIAAAFRAALARALEALPKPKGGSGPVTFEDLLAAMNGPNPMRAIADDLVIVIVEIQRLRDSDPMLDRFFRERCVLTRVRAVRA
jgi:hypothetical protein